MSRAGVSLSALSKNFDEGCREIRLREPVAYLFELRRFYFLAGQQQSVSHFSQCQAQSKCRRGKKRGSVQRFRENSCEFGIPNRIRGHGIGWSGEPRI